MKSTGPRRSEGSRSDRNLEARIEKHAAAIVEALGYELVELKYARGPRRGLLRVVLDSDPGISHEDCALFSKQLGEALDREDFIGIGYNLEVSSPGAFRPFSKLDHYLRNVDKSIEIDLKEPVAGRHRVTGVLVEAAADRLKVRDARGEELDIPMDMVRKATRSLRF